MGEGASGSDSKVKTLWTEDRSVLPVKARVWQEQFSNNNNDLNMNTLEAVMEPPVATVLTPPSLAPRWGSSYLTCELVQLLNFSTFVRPAVSTLATPA